MQTDTIAASTPRFLNREQVADLLGISKSTLKLMSKTGNGPPEIRLSQDIIRIDTFQLEAWIQSRTEGV
jgi:predicted DNA-binding transcriptional regulator AlpA